MVKTVTRFFILTLSNYLTLNLSKDVDVDQLVKDIESISLNINITYESLYLSVSFLISLISIFLIYFFRPFSEMYLIYYLKISYYFFINLVSLSSVYIVLRIVGYSRLNLLIYLLFILIFLLLSEKISKNIQKPF